MRYKKIQFYNFRNLEDCTVEFDSNIIYLIGENAQGKTNFLEALYLLSYGSSFRTRTISDLKKYHTKNFNVLATYSDEYIVDHTIQFRWHNKEREIFVDSTRIVDRKALINIFPCIIFAYNDYNLVTGSSELKRTYIDQMQCFQSIDYIDIMRNYKKILKNRNAALKNNTVEILEFYNTQLSQVGFQIMKAREKIINECKNLAKTMFKEISDSQEVLSFEYIPAWNNCESADDIAKVLEDTLTFDLLCGYTCSGTHRDKIIYTINDKNVSEFASTGQVRIISLILRVIQAHIVANYTQKKPVLLLDDVLLELDQNKRERVLSLLPPSSQTFFTLLETVDKNIAKNDREFQCCFVKNGKIL